MTSYYFGVSLRVWHGTRSPTEISEALGRQPNVVGIKGDRKGSASSRAIWSEHYWGAQFDNEGESPADRIAAIARFVEANEKAMRSLLQSGGKAEVYAFIGVEREEIGFIVDSTVLAILGRVGVDLDLDIFPPTPKVKSKASGRKNSP
jgi:hypothetical protein